MTWQGPSSDVPGYVSEPTTSPAASAADTPRAGLTGHVSRLVAGEAVSKLSRFLAMSILARSLTASDFGRVNLGIAIGGLLFVISSLGLSEAGAREVAAAPERAGWFAGRIIGARSAGLFVLAVPLCIALAFVDMQLLAVALAGAGMAQMTILGADWLARGLERTRVLALGSAAGGLCVLGGVAAFHGRADADVALIAFVIGEAIAASILWWLVTRRTRPMLGLRGVGPLLREARPLALSVVVLYAYYSTLDTILIAALRSNAEAGLYSAPYRIFLMFSIVATFAAYSMLPPRVRAAQAGIALRDDPSFRRALPVLAAYGLAALAAVELVGPTALGILFGDRFEQTQPTLILLSCGVCWYSIGYPVGYSLIADGAYRRFLRGATVAAVLSVGLNLVLIPWIGYVGAAATTLASVMSAAVLWLAYQDLLAVELRLVAAAALATAGGIVAAAAPATADAAGALTLALVVIVLVSWHAGNRGSGLKTPSPAGGPP